MNYHVKIESETAANVFDYGNGTADYPYKFSSTVIISQYKVLMQNKIIGLDHLSLNYLFESGSLPFDLSFKNFHLENSDNIRLSFQARNLSGQQVITSTQQLKLSDFSEINFKNIQVRFEEPGPLANGVRTCGLLLQNIAEGVGLQNTNLSSSVEDSV